MSIAPEKRRRVVRTGLIFLWLACLALLRPPLSLATGTRGNASVGMVVLSSPRAGGRVGDPIPCRLEITVANQARLDPGSLAQLEIRPDKLPGELYRSWLPASGRSAAAAGEKIVLRGKITIYAPGQYRISTSPLVCRLRDENGKTRLVDLFYNLLPLAEKRRTHFHRFMGDIHYAGTTTQWGEGFSEAYRYRMTGQSTSRFGYLEAALNSLTFHNPEQGGRLAKAIPTAASVAEARRAIAQRRVQVASGEVPECRVEQVEETSDQIAETPEG